MTILTYFTCMERSSHLIFNKVMQSMFLALFFFFFFSEVTILDIFHHVLQVKQILFYGLCSKRFEDISQET